MNAGLDLNPSPRFGADITLIARAATLIASPPNKPRLRLPAGAAVPVLSLPPLVRLLRYSPRASRYSSSLPSRLSCRMRRSSAPSRRALSAILSIRFSVTVLATNSGIRPSFSSSATSDVWNREDLMGLLPPYRRSSNERWRYCCCRRMTEIWHPLLPLPPERLGTTLLSDTKPCRPSSSSVEHLYHGLSSPPTSRCPSSYMG